LALATFALHLDAFEARLKRSGQRQTPKSLLGAIEPDPSTGAATALDVPQAKPDPARVDKTAAEGI
jgi:hypothetical protein